MRIIRLLILPALLFSEAGAQVLPPFGRTSSTLPRFELSGDLVLSRPRGEFASYVGSGFGFDVTGLLRISDEGWLTLRFDLGGVQYGRETMRVPLLPSTGRVSVDVNTSNTIGFLSVGPQISIPLGFIKPYAHVAWGGTAFTTTSSVEGSDSYGAFASTNNASDVTSAWIAGAGVYIPLTRGPSPVSLNFGGRYFQGGEATYLREGGITDNPDGSITLHPIRSKTDFVLWQLGVSVPIRSSTRR
jgi:opacity protein-like surface antigen